jgi:outer membrane lipoprotein-sorting protein
MDTAAAAFKGMSAKLQRVQHTAILNDSTTDAGVIRMLRVKPGDMRVLVELTEPDPKMFGMRQGKAEIYYPKAATVEEYDLGKHKGLVEQFFLLGFGAPGRDLLKSYKVTLAGSDTINGQPVSHLDLVPKSKIKGSVEIVKIELWINSSGYPLRQKFLEPSGNYQMATYSDLKINPELTTDSVTLKTPANAKRVFPQK